MKASKRLRAIAKQAMGEMDKEFHREWLVRMIAGGFRDEWNSDQWKRFGDISEEEARQVVDLLERSGRIIEDIEGIHKGEESGFCYPTEFYPRTTAGIRAYKKSREYREWLGWKKYGRTPSWMRGGRAKWKPPARKQPERMTQAMPKECPICDADLTKTVCEHTWKQMLLKMWG